MQLISQGSNEPNLSLDSWVATQIAEFDKREGLDEALERVASQIDPAGIGLSGGIVDTLFNGRPRMIPRLAWGGSMGWRSTRRLKRWERLLARCDVPFVGNNNGIMVRFIINAKHWVPHPYCPPSFCLVDFECFARYITNSIPAWELCQLWRAENAAYITETLRDQLAGFPVNIGASYRCYNNIDYAEVAFYSEDPDNCGIQLKAAWKRENLMAKLIAGNFTDSHREYSPPWLRGQRIDVFIPSLNVAFEYQGEQHHRPIDYFGGNDGFLRTKERDVRKKTLCANNGVVLIEWQYYEVISQDRLKAKLAEHGIPI